MITHRELCLIGAKHMKRQGIAQRWQKPNYVVCELERAGESPDVFGFGGCLTQLLEVKVSRSDFLSDKKKNFRKHPALGIGQLRAYLCPDGLIKESEIPYSWGLYYYDEIIKITRPIKYPTLQISNTTEEMNLASALLRRNGVNPKIFNYKKYKNKSEKL